MMVGNDCPEIIFENLKCLNETYPSNKVFIYDWGYEPSNIERMEKIHANVSIVRWYDADESNYMYEKVRCIHDCFLNSNEHPLIYLDSDVIVTSNIDEIFDDKGWDIGATWRPEYDYKAEEFGVGSWLNAGVLFINSLRPENSLKFLESWLERCKSWKDRAWWLDQVELIRMFSLVEGDDLSKEAPRKGVLLIDSFEIQCKTFHYTTYNFFPNMIEKYDGYEPRKAKIIHLKSQWRKKELALLPESLRKIRVKSYSTEWGNTGGFRKIIKIINISYSFFKRLPYRFERKIRNSFFPNSIGSELFYWRQKKLSVGNLYFNELKRTKQYLNVFEEQKQLGDIHNKVIVDIGTGPIGGVAEYLQAKEKWVIEPIVSSYKKAGVWIPKSKIEVRETFAEKMEGVPNEYFDIVFSMNALDHGDDIRVCFSNINKILKLDGYFYLHVHCRQEFELNELHRQPFLENDLLGWLENEGFEVISSRMFSEDPVPTNKYRTFVGVMKKVKDK